jgi:hypothetical protein
MAAGFDIAEPDADSIVLQPATLSTNPLMMRYDAILVFMALPPGE